MNMPRQQLFELFALDLLYLGIKSLRNAWGFSWDCTELLRLEGVSGVRSNPLLRAGSARAAWSGPYLVGFECLRIETPQPLWAACSWVWPPSQLQSCFLTFKFMLLSLALSMDTTGKSLALSSLLLSCLFLSPPPPRFLCMRNFYFPS